MLRKLLASASAVAVLGLVSIGMGSQPVSASPGAERSFRFTAVSTTDNPCEPDTVPISLMGSGHAVWYWTPDGTLKMNIQSHLTGTDADGTEYVANMQRHMEHPAWPSISPFNDTFTTNLISKGATVNAQIVMTFDMFPSNPVVTVTACRG